MTTRTRNTAINQIVRTNLDNAGWDVFVTYSDLRASGIRRLAYKRNGYALSSEKEDRVLTRIKKELRKQKLPFIDANWYSGACYRGMYRYVAVTVQG